MTRQTIRTDYLKAIDWLNDSIVDWVYRSQLYSLDGDQQKIGKYHYAFRAWDMHKFPKLINIQTGEVESTIEDIDSGLQNSSIRRYDSDFPQIVSIETTLKLPSELMVRGLKFLAHSWPWFAKNDSQKQMVKNP